MLGYRKLLTNSIGLALKTWRGQQQLRCNNTNASTAVGALATSLTPSQSTPALATENKIVIDPLEHDDFFGINELVTVEDMFK